MTTPYSSTPFTSDVEAPVQAPPPRAVKMDRYKPHFFGFGIAEIIFGVACLIVTFLRIAFGISSITGITLLFIPNSGFIIATGIIGIMMKFKSSQCIYTANVVMSGISTLAASNLILNSVFEISFGYFRILYVFEIVFAFSAFVLCLVHSVFCCIGSCNTCCGQASYQGQVLYPNYEQQYVHLGNGQYMLVQGQPLEPTLPSNQPLAENPTLYPQIQPQVQPTSEETQIAT